MKVFWDGLAQLFGYDSWSWGSAGEWFGAVGTVLAFAVAFMAIFLDRRKSRMELANLFSTSLSVSGSKDHDSKWKVFEVHVHVFNGGSMPVQGGLFYAPADKFDVSHVPFSARNDPNHGGVAIFDDRSPRVLPNEGFDIFWTYPGEVNTNDFHVSFTDGRGKRHFRRMSDGTFRRKLPKAYRNSKEFRTPRRLGPEKTLQNLMDVMQPPAAGTPTPYGSALPES